MKCHDCGSTHTQYIQKTMNGHWYFVVHCLNCGKDRLPTNEERSAFND